MVIPLLYSICRSELGTMGQWVDLVVSSTPPPFYIWIPSFMTMSGWVTTPLTPCSASMVCYGEIAKVSVHLLWVRHCAQQLTCIISLTLHNNLLGWNLQMMKLWNQDGSGTAQGHPCIKAGTTRGLSDSTVHALPHHTVPVLVSTPIWMNWFSSDLGNLFPAFSWTASL